MAVLKIFSSPHYSYDEQVAFWLWYPTCAKCRTDRDPYGEEWVEVDSNTDRFGRRSWQECLDMSLNHLKERHG